MSDDEIVRAARAALDAGVRQDIATLRGEMLTVFQAGQEGLLAACREWCKRLDEALGLKGTTDRGFRVQRLGFGDVDPDTIDNPEAIGITWAFRFLCAAGNGDDATTLALMAVAAEAMGPGGPPVGNGPAALFNMTVAAITGSPAWSPVQYGR
jgi:hypothetical protein